MKIRDLVKLTNTYLAGEQLVYHRLVPFYDSVIDEINSRLDSTFPSFSSFDFDLSDPDVAYDFFPDKYMRSVVALGAAHKFYEMDEEGVVYDTSYEQDYERNLFYMTRDYIEQVPEEFQADNTGSVITTTEDYIDNFYPFYRRCRWS